MAVKFAASTPDEVILLADIRIESYTEYGTDRSTTGRMAPATVYRSLIACNLNVTTASENGETIECGDYEDPS